MAEHCHAGYAIIVDGDVFGAMLMAALYDRSVLEVVERADGFVNTLPSSRYFDPPDAWKAVDRWAIEQCRGRVLDIGAGAGRAALDLQERRHDVVALDSSPGAVEVCRLRGVCETMNGRLELFDQAAQFDTFLLLGNNIGLLQSMTQGRTILRALAVTAPPHAVIVGTSVDPSLTANEQHHRYQAANVARGRLPGQLRLRSRFASKASSWFDYLLVSPTELDSLLEDTGWVRRRSFEQNEHYAAVLERA